MHDYSWIKAPVRLLLLFIFVGVYSVSAVADAVYHRHVNGVDFFLAVIPAEMTQGESAMQSSRHETRYHVIVSIFDSHSGKRIKDAEIQANVSTINGMTQQDKNLVPMFIMDAASYGNYFLMSDAGKYRLRFKMLSAIRKYEITAEFIFDRPKD